MNRMLFVLAAAALLYGTSRPPVWCRREHQDTTQEKQNLEAEGGGCEFKGKEEIRIDCIYRIANSKTLGTESKPQIVLNHAVITFEPKHESRMRIELTFTNEAKTAVTERRTVYIEFNDPAGENHIRRPLPHVDFQKLSPGEPVTFVDQFLAPALRPDRYFVRLWIPSPDPERKFDATQNLLLSNEGMADHATGLNRIATIMVKDSGPASSVQDR